MSKASVLALLSTCVFAACGPDGRDENTDGDGDGDGDGSGSDVTEQPRQCEKMDIVFIVDDSGSMAEEQQNLASNFPLFAEKIRNYTVPNGQPLDFRVALTTTARDINYTVNVGFGSFPQSETGDNGEFRNTCNNTDRWLDKNSPNFDATMACRANVGTMGSGIEMPLLMTKWALAERIQDGTNAGFLREDALLAVVVLTDEDDSSTTEDGFTMDSTGTTPINFHGADLAAFLDQVKGNRTRWAAGVIAGEGNCSSGFGNAADGVRLKEFVNQANSGGYQQAVFSSICDGDLTIGLQKALDLFQAACGQIIL
jgi:hypothetical protein